MTVWVIVKTSEVATEIYLHATEKAATENLREIVSEYCDNEPEDQPTEHESIEDLLQRFELVSRTTTIMCVTRPLDLKES